MVTAVVNATLAAAKTTATLVTTSRTASVAASLADARMLIGTIESAPLDVQSYTHLIRNVFFDALSSDSFFANYTVRKNRMLRVQHELMPYLGVYIIDEPMAPDGDANAGNIRFIHTPRIGFSIMLVNNDQDACEAALDAAYWRLFNRLWNDPYINNVFDTFNWITGYQNPGNVRFESIERGMRRYVWGNTTINNQTPVGELQYDITVKFRSYAEPGPFVDLLTLDVKTGVKPGDTQAEMDQRQQLHVQYQFDPSSFAAKREFRRQQQRSKSNGNNGRQQSVIARTAHERPNQENAGASAALAHRQGDAKR
jgi:hypothetical protein